MKSFKLISSVFLLLVISFTFTQCASSQKLQTNPPFKIGETYFQNWTSDVKKDGSGTNLYISINPNNQVTLDSVYFKNQVKKLELSKKDIYVAQFRTQKKQLRNINLSSKPQEEYGNTVQKEPKPIPFILSNNQCVITYKIGKKSMYYKIVNISEKPAIKYPSASPNKQ